ncbi:MAG: oligosaccharyl transferase, archaeosortase A system-associated, partial [Halobacteriota archaeon]|nr:oligosaccharyl transferase, archaeosortase A system-associated [Halobacteriota archaeon]
DIIVSGPGGVENATISIGIKTNQNRTFTYNQTETVGPDGKFHFTVPYSTDGPVAGGTQFDTMATSLYTVKVGSSTKEVAVTEEEVMNGERIEIRV